MNKVKTLLILCLGAALGAGMLAGCKPTEDPEHTAHIDEDNNGYCDICSEPMGEGPEPVEEYELTDGVFLAQVDASHRTLIKFYEDNTFYIEGMQGNALKGVYEVKEESITYRPSKENLEPDPESEHAQADTAIYLYEEDGTTPVKVNRNTDGDEYYAVGTADNALAYANDTIYNVTYDGFTRSLAHSPLNPFSENDEKAIEQYRFMLKNEEDIPEGAEEGAVVQDYYFILTQKDYTSWLTGIASTGGYEADGNVYTLNDLITGAEYGTLTVNEDGSASLETAEKTFELVPYADPAEIVFSLTGDATVMGMNATLTLDLLDSGSYNISATIHLSAGDMNGGVVETGSYTLSGGQYTFTSDSGSALTATTDGANVSVAYEGTINGSAVSTTFTGSTVKVLKTLKTTQNVGIEVEFALIFTSDGRAALTASMMGSSIEFTADWVLDTSAGVPSVVFSNPSAGEFASGWGENSTVVFTWTGKLSDNMPSDTTLTFSMAATELADLQVTPAVTTMKELKTTRNVGIEVEFTLTFTSDGRAALTASMMGSSIEFTADWVLDTSAGVPSVVFSNPSTGEFTSGWGENSTVVFTWTGKLSDNMPSDTTLTFSMPASELADLQ